MDSLEYILQLSKAERDARVSGAWKADLDAAIERHGDCVAALFEELYRQLDERAGAGEPVVAMSVLAGHSIETKPTERETMITKTKHSVSRVYPDGKKRTLDAFNSAEEAAAYVRGLLASRALVAGPYRDDEMSAMDFEVVEGVLVFDDGDDDDEGRSCPVFVPNK